MIRNPNLTTIPETMEQNRNIYKADRRLYRDPDGNIVEASDPSRRSLVVAEGQTMPMAKAIALGLVDRKDAPKGDDKSAEKSDDKSAQKSSNKSAPKAENKKG